MSLPTAALPGAEAGTPDIEKFQRLVEAARTARGQDVLSAERELRDACSPERVSDLLTHVAALTSDVARLTEERKRLAIGYDELVTACAVQEEVVTALREDAERWRAVRAAIRNPCTDTREVERQVLLALGHPAREVDGALDALADAFRAARLASPSPTGAP